MWDGMMRESEEKVLHGRGFVDRLDSSSSRAPRSHSSLCCVFFKLHFHSDAMLCVDDQHKKNETKKILHISAKFTES